MVSTGKSVFGWIEGPVEFGRGAEDAPSSSSGLITQVPTKTWQGELQGDFFHWYPPKSS